MKLISFQVQNLGPIEDVNLTIDKPLTTILGQPEAGKSTLLRSIIWACGGAFPSDILKHGCEEGFVDVRFENATLRREFYRGKDGATKARELQFVRDGQVVKRPVEELKKLLNPFLLDENFFVDKNEKERQLYLVEFLGVDTKAEDLAIKQLEEAARAARQAVDRLGERTPVTPCEAPDLVALQGERKRLSDEWQAAVTAKALRQREIDETERKRRDIIDEINTFAEIVAKAQTNLDTQTLEAEEAAVARDRLDYSRVREGIDIVALKRIDDLQRQIEAVKADWESQKAAAAAQEAEAITATHRRFADRRTELAASIVAESEQLEASKAALAAIPVLEPLPEPTLNTTEIDAKIAEAGQAQAKHTAYVAYKDWSIEKNDAVARQRTAEASLKEAREKKRAKLSALATTCPVQGMTFTDDGQPVFESTTMDMLSGSQARRLSSAIAALYPTELGIELVDGGERFSRRIAEYVEYAEKNNRKVLTTIVADEPVVVSDQIGVFVIEDGKLKL